MLHFLTLPTKLSHFPLKSLKQKCMPPYQASWILRLRQFIANTSNRQIRPLQMMSSPFFGSVPAILQEEVFTDLAGACVLSDWRHGSCVFWEDCSFLLMGPVLSATQKLLLPLATCPAALPLHKLTFFWDEALQELQGILPAAATEMLLVACLKHISFHDYAILKIYN